MTELTLQPILEAHEPPEARGSGRDDVALLVANRSDGSLIHSSLSELPRLLQAGDLLVVNTSATLPAALRARHGGHPVELRLSTPIGANDWIVELREIDAAPHKPPPSGARLQLPSGAHADVLSPLAGSARLVIARLQLGQPLETYLGRHGRPIRYPYVREQWPLEAYQTVFALHPGSAEMPSAARPFTTALVTELVSRGILIAPITLHTGVSSPELDEPPLPERFDVPPITAQIINAARGWQGRVIAVGTTVVRALETATHNSTLSAAHGSTDLLITPETGVHAVDGLLTGWHEPRSTHLQILEALAGRELIHRSYREASKQSYRHHEFGDLHLILTR